MNGHYDDGGTRFIWWVKEWIEGDPSFYVLAYSYAIGEVTQSFVFNSEQLHQFVTGLGK